MCSSDLLKHSLPIMMRLKRLYSIPNRRALKPTRSQLLHAEGVRLVRSTVAGNGRLIGSAKDLIVPPHKPLSNADLRHDDASELTSVKIECNSRTTADVHGPKVWNMHTTSSAPAALPAVRNGRHNQLGV